MFMGRSLHGSFDSFNKAKATWSKGRPHAHDLSERWARSRASRGSSAGLGAQARSREIQLFSLARGARCDPISFRCDLAASTAENYLIEAAHSWDIRALDW